MAEEQNESTRGKRSQIKKQLAAVEKIVAVLKPLSIEQRAKVLELTATMLKDA